MRFSLDGFQPLVSCIHTPGNALTLLIQGGSRMRESRPYGFVRGVLGDWHPYRDSHSSDSNSASPPSAQEIDVPFSHYWKLWSRLRSSGIVANGFGKGIRGVIRRRGELAGDVAFGNGTFFDPEHGRAGVSIENEQTPTLGSGSDDRD